MKEKDLQQNAKAIMEKHGIVAWFPPRTWGERDIMGIFDFIAFKGTKMWLVQMTTIDHLSHRRKKILDFCAAHELKISSARIWAWDKKKNKFRIFKI